MPPCLLLASRSSARRSLLRRAGLRFETLPVEIDEDAIRVSLHEKGVGPEEIAFELAERKARMAARVDTRSVIFGCDQILEFEGEVLAKPKDMEDARRQLGRMNGRSHRLHSAATVYERGQPVQRLMSCAELHMRESTGKFLDGYVMRNWPDIGDSVGCYRIEEEGVRLFHRIDGDYFAILGLPLLEILAYLRLRGWIPG